MEQITAENIHLHTDAQILHFAGCFGRSWNPWDRQCTTCAAYARCLHNLALVALPQEALERNCYDADHDTGTLDPKVERLDMNELAAEFSSDPRALAYAVHYHTKTVVGLPVMQTDGSLLPSMEGPPRIGEASVQKAVAPGAEDLLDDVLDSLVEEEEEVPKKAPRKTKKKTVPVEKAITPKKAPVKKTAPVAPVKSRVQKKSTKKVPQKAPAMKATTVVSPDAFARRFEADCKKYPMKIGATVTRMIDGKPSSHTVTKQAKGYKYAGEMYPTLLAVSMAQGNVREDKGLMRRDGTCGVKIQAAMAANRWFKQLKR